MKRNEVSLTILAAISITTFVLACSQEQQPSQSTNSPTILLGSSQADTVKYGEYLVTGVGCHDCHSPKVFGPQGPEPDPSRLLAGHIAGTPLPPVDKAALKSWYLFSQDLTAFSGPWGVSFAANITSDETGIGNWTEEQFFRAMREGKFKGAPEGRQILPPMPWPAFSKLNDTDLKAIFAYLKSTKPIKNVVPPPISPENIK